MSSCHMRTFNCGTKRRSIFKEPLFFRPTWYFHMRLRSMELLEHIFNIRLGKPVLYLSKLNPLGGETYFLMLNRVFEHPTHAVWLAKCPCFSKLAFC